ncbi:hypothetical protein PHMEG_00033697 [Phytophthora megakarya]|uniref:Uncharacterized protein n=1 Tax=Phytophthora megakarya TaxID=4795 RepID=A0A225USR5_9STRA|nr:hypothetical protein PHMEG_00033697 [Phytophthora megakarya]
MLYLDRQDLAELKRKKNTGKNILLRLPDLNLRSLKQQWNLVAYIPSWQVLSWMRNLGGTFAEATSDDEEIATEDVQPSSSGSDDCDLGGVTYDDIVESEEVNVTSSNEDAEELTELDSDGENDDGLDDSAGEEFELLSDKGVDDDDIVIQPDMLFDEGILAAVGGVERVSLGIIEKTVLDEMANDGWTDLTKCTPYPYMDTPHELPEPKAVFDEYPRLYKGPFGPTNEAKAAARSPSGAFFYFMTPRLWDDIAQASNEYFLEKLEERVEGQFQKQVGRKLKKAGYCRETKGEIRKR